MAVSLIIPLYRSQNNVFLASVFLDSKDQNSLLIYKDLQLKGINSNLIDLGFSVKLAQNLVQAGFIEDGLLALEKLHKSDPRNLDVINALALSYEAYNKIPEAIYYRKKMASLNPFNALNYLFLGRDYKKQGDVIKTQEMLEKVLSFPTGPNTEPIIEQAKKELTD
jgi:tetratricopeptide (TPR) repeat protein